MHECWIKTGGGTKQYTFTRHFLCKRYFIGTLRGQYIEDIRDAQYASARRNVLAIESVGITMPIPCRVMMEYDLNEEWINIAANQHACSDHRMALHRAPFIIRK